MSRAKHSRRGGRRVSGPITRRQSSPRRAQGLGRIETLALVAACFAFIAVVSIALHRSPGPAGSIAVGSSAAALPPQAGQALRPQEYDTPAAAVGGNFECAHPVVIDGDTVKCGSLRVRLASIDAPELPGHCRRGRVCTPGDPVASSNNLRRIVGKLALDCRQTDTDRYGRAVAYCLAGGVNLSCAQVQGGFAVVRYGTLSCS